jgi:hypothetical protein
MRMGALLLALFRLRAVGKSIKTASPMPKEKAEN